MGTNRAACFSSMSLFTVSNVAFDCAMALRRRSNSRAAFAFWETRPLSPANDSWGTTEHQTRQVSRT